MYNTNKIKTIKFTDELKDLVIAWMLENHWTLGKDYWDNRGREHAFYRGGSHTFYLHLGFMGDIINIEVDGHTVIVDFDPHDPESLTNLHNKAWSLFHHEHYRNTPKSFKSKSCPEFCWHLVLRCDSCASYSINTLVCAIHGDKEMNGLCEDFVCEHFDGCPDIEDDEEEDENWIG